MKKHTAAQIRAAQAVVDREEAIEAERERRRAEKAQKAREARSAWLSKQRSSVRHASAVVGKFFWYLLGQIALVVIGGSALIVLLQFLMTGGIYPDFGDRLMASAQLAFLFWASIVSRLPELPGGVWYVVLAFLPWYVGFVAFLIALKFGVFPLIRFIISKAQR